MHSAIRNRLSVMMFLQYAAPGFTAPILSHYLLNYLHLRPEQAGYVLAMPAIAMLVSPLLGAYIVDRVISAERLLGFCHLGAAVLAVSLSMARGFWPFLLLSVLYGLSYAPSSALTNAVAFHHVRDAKRDFGGIRMWGPVAWVVAGCGFSFLWLRFAPETRLGHAFLFSATSSLLLAFYTLTLPRTGAIHAQAPRQGVRASLRVAFQPGLAIVAVLSFVNGMVHQFYYYGMSPFLHQLRMPFTETLFPNDLIMPVMSLGQCGEAIVLMFLGRMLARIGIKWAMVIGALAQALRSVCFAIGEPISVVAIIPLHGFCYAFFFSVGFIYADLHCKPTERGGVQQIFNLLSLGLGVLFGNMLAGKVAAYFQSAPGVIDFPRFWLVPAAMGFTVAIVLAIWLPASAAAREQVDRG